MSELVLDEPDPQPGSPSVSGSESVSLPVEALTFGIRASTSCSDSSVPSKTTPGLRLSDLLPAICSNGASVPEASESSSPDASTFNSISSKSLSTFVRLTTGKTSILSAGIFEVIFTEFVGTVISVVLAVVSETEVGLGVVLELVELRGSSPARGIVDVVFVVVEAVVIVVVVEVVEVVLVKNSQNSKTSQKYWGFVPRSSGFKLKTSIT